MFFRIWCIAKPLYLRENQIVEFSVSTVRREIMIQMEDCPIGELLPTIKAGVKCVASTLEDMEPDKLTTYRDSGGKKENTVKEFLDEIRSDLSETLKRTIYDYRWRHAILSSFNPIINNSSLSWSPDGVTWKPAYPLQELRLETRMGFVMQQTNEQTIQSLSQLVADRVEEPTGHELYNEAYELKDRNPRSSLVIGIAALETGIKECASHLLPNAEWLINHVPSPPLAKMLSNMIPQWPAVNTIEGKVVAPPKSIIKRVADAVETRNKIAHGQVAEVKYEELWEFLRAARDLLYLFDYYCGYGWAWQNIGHRTQQELIAIAKNNS